MKLTLMAAPLLTAKKYIRALPLYNLSPLKVAAVSYRVETTLHDCFSHHFNIEALTFSHSPGVES